jgi:hypothetical protein
VDAQNSRLPCVGNAQIYDALFAEEPSEQRERAQATASALCGRCPRPCPDKVTPASGPRVAADLPLDWLPEHREGRSLYSGKERWHGTASGVVTYVCPCSACTDAHTADRNRRNAISLGRSIAIGRAYIPTEHRVSVFARMALDLHHEGRTPADIALALCVSEADVPRLVDHARQHLTGAAV